MRNVLSVIAVSFCIFFFAVVQANAVTPITQALVDLIDNLPSEELSTQISNSLKQKAMNAERQVSIDNANTAINILEAFINEVEAQNGKNITDTTATLLIEYANNIIIQINQLTGEFSFGPPSVQASDIESGLTNIEINWNIIPGATFYKIFIAQEFDGEYVEIASVTDATYVFVEDWYEDVIGAVGELPKFDNFSTPAAFREALFIYNKKIEPLIDTYKSVRYFKVQACNSNICGEISVADAGQADFVHTAEYSDIAQMMINAMGYPLLITLSEMPTEPIQLISWPGMSIKGSFGGSVTTYVYPVGSDIDINIIYDEYSGKKVTINGVIGGLQDVITVIYDKDLTIKGDLIVSSNFFSTVGLYLDLSINLDDGLIQMPNDAIDVTYKGETYRYSFF